MTVEDLLLLTAGSWNLLFGLRTLCALTAARLKDHEVTPPVMWPSLSVVVPACNEGGTLESAVRTLIAQHYPFLQIILVNDRSTDDTAAVMQRLATDDPRIEIVTIETLPSGWLGKVHAMQRGLERATGELLLFADADTHYGPGVLSNAVALLERRGLVHLTLLPRLRTTGLWQAMMMAAFFDGYIERRRGSRSPVLPPTGPLFGFGAFNLVRRAAFDKTPGLAWLKLDIADDLALARMMRDQGSTGCVVAHESLSLLYYATLRECLNGFKRTAFPLIAQFSIARAIALIVGVSWLFVATILCIFFTSGKASVTVLVSAGLLCAANAIIGRIRLGRTLRGALLEPLAILLMIVVLIRSMRDVLRRGGVFWRGTLYPTAELRAEQRSYFL